MQTLTIEVPPLGRSSLLRLFTRKSFIIIKNRLRFEDRRRRAERRNQKFLIFPFNFLIHVMTPQITPNASRYNGTKPFSSNVAPATGDLSVLVVVRSLRFASSPSIRFDFSVRSKRNDPTSHPSKPFYCKFFRFFPSSLEWRYAFSFLLLLHKEEKKQIIGVSAWKNYLFSGLLCFLRKAKADCGFETAKINLQTISLERALNSRTQK
jgi:hypothetical protein